MDLLLSKETRERNRTLKGESQRPLLAIMETVNLYITDFPVPLLLFHEKKYSHIISSSCQYHCHMGRYQLFNDLASKRCDNFCPLSDPATSPLPRLQNGGQKLQQIKSRSSGKVIVLGTAIIFLTKIITSTGNCATGIL